METEFGIIQRFFSTISLGDASVPCGIGDDCAVLNLTPGHQLAVSMDTLVAGRHFLENAHPYDIATRALAVNLSDLAAMGATPKWFTLGLTLPEVDVAWLKCFSKGLSNMASDHSCLLVGGDTTQGPLSITIQVHGELPAGKALKRSLARVGDSVYVSAHLGDGAAALMMLQKQLAVDEVEQAYLHQRFYAPEPQIALGQALLNKAHAAIDVSDGLLADLGHIAEQSGVGMNIFIDQLPFSPVVSRVAKTDRAQALAWALSGGDDYQLAFTGPAGLMNTIDNITCIGEVVQGDTIACYDGDTLFNYQGTHGYQHFT